MKLTIELATYDGTLASQAFSWVVPFLAIDSQDFGEAIEYFHIVVYFHSGDPARLNLEKLHESFHARLRKLPTTLFVRKEQKLIIEYESKIGSAKELSDVEVSFNKFTLAPVAKSLIGVPQANRFNEFFLELKAALLSIKSYLEPGDDFAFERFASWLESKSSLLPSSDDELGILISKLDISCRDQAARVIERDLQESGVEEKIDRYQQARALGFAEEQSKAYHVDTKALLDDPFFGDEQNEFSPHGNDSGHDVLTAFTKWRQIHPFESSVSFFFDLMSEWGLSEEIMKDPRRLREKTRETIDDLNIPMKGSSREEFIDSASRSVRRMYEQAVIALAFAHIKLDGHAPKWISDLAFAVIDSNLQNDLSEFEVKCFSKIKYKLMELKE